MDGLKGIARRRLRWATLVTAAIALSACGEELPTTVGGDLVGGGELRTFELLLPASEFLAADTTLAGFGSTNRLGVLLVAQDYLGQLDMHALLRPAPFPDALTYTGAGDSVRVDSMPRFVGGELVVRLDTVALGLDTLGTDTSMVFELYPLTEAWDARTATWTVRSAEAGDTLLWSQPGGTTGPLIDSATWVRGDSVIGDTIVFELDSATIAAWSDGSDAVRGALLRTPTAGVRARVAVVRLRLLARPSEQPDTVVNTNISTIDQTFIFDPPPPPPLEGLRIGGRAGWRSILTFRDSLFDLRLPCPDGDDTCDFRLGDATVNSAQLRLVPLEVPELYLPELSMLVEARRLLGPADLPLTRAPVADTTGASGLLTRETFESPDGEPVTIGVTGFVTGLAMRPDSTPTVRDRQLALVPAPEPGIFGFAAFGGIETAGMQPVLRLIVTVVVPEEEQ